MKTVSYEAPERLIAWAESRIDGGRFRPDARAIGLLEDYGRRICAAVIYDTHSTTGCFVSVASDGTGHWITREFIIHAFAYPFLQCGYSRISAIVSEHNADSLRFTRHFGWVEEGRMRGAGNKGEDCVLFGMLREECRFITGKIFVNRL